MTIRSVSLAILSSALLSLSGRYCAGQTAEGTATVVNGFVVGVTIVEAGSGYPLAPGVSFIGGGGKGAGAYAQIANGSVVSITVTNTGAGYSSPPTVVIDPPFFDLGNLLVGYWPFEGTIHDASTHQQTGVVSGSISYPSGAVGSAAAISGSSYVSFGNPSDRRYDVASGDDFTVSIWIRTQMSGAALNWPMLLAKNINDGSDSAFGWVMYFGKNDNGALGFGLQTGNPSGAAGVSYGRPNDNQWHHVVAVKKQNTLASYLDGVLYGTNSCRNVDYVNSAPLLLGKNLTASLATYQGAVDELRIYKRALAPFEIAMLYRRLPVITNPENAVAYWGGTATFCTTAAGTTPPTYQWFKDGEPIPEGINACLTITNVQAVNAGIYKVTVRNSFGIVYSQSATLTVNPAGVTAGVYAGLTIEGVVGWSYAIQFVTDIAVADWTTITNITLQQPVTMWFDGSIDVRNPTPRFYQVTRVQ